MNNPYALPMQMWRTGFDMWMSAMDAQMSMMSAMLPRARETAREVEEIGEPVARATTDFAAKAAQDIANARPGAMPV